MKLNQEELKKLLAENKSLDRGQCPSSDDLARLRTGTISAEERSLLAQHVSSCADCAEEYRIATAGADLISERRQKATTTFKPQWAFGLAAVLIAAALAGILVFRQSGVVNEGNERGVLIQTEIVPNPEDGISLKTAPSEFSWTEIPGATAYTLVLYDYQSTQIAQLDTGSSTRLNLSGTDMNKLKPGSTYYWRVQYKTVEGSGESKLFRFSIE